MLLRKMLSYGGTSPRQLVPHLRSSISKHAASEALNVQAPRLNPYSHSSSSGKSSSSQHTSRKSVRFLRIPIETDLGDLLDLIIAASAGNALVPLVDSRITYAYAMVIPRELMWQ
jgi:hypothetical protein